MQPSFFRAGFALFIASLGWALAPVFIRMLKEEYDPYTQAFLRYLTATVVLLWYCLLAHRRELLRLIQRPAALIAIGLMSAVMQYTWTAGCYGATATVAQLISKLSLVFVIVLSYFLFREERAVIRSPLYVIGTVISVVGLTAVLVRDRASMVPKLDSAAVLLLITSLLWAAYTVWAKHLVTHAHPVPVFAVMSVFTTLGLGGMSAVYGTPASILEAGSWATTVVATSGVIPIAIAHPCFHYSQKRLGSALSSTINLLNPVMTYAIALTLWSDEALLLPQWLGAAALLLGTLLVARAWQLTQNQTAALPQVREGHEELF
ncbi:MAG: DMT family transporter [Candidatus Hydrogenedentes bacterium]|nr:DMT family transporter [Candidatus Hydrogenedentota bacterium]